jgi:organic radical activating enzyme
VVLTGGEPLLQQRLLATLCEGLKQDGKRVEIETNGTVLPDSRLATLVDQWNVSPKLANSGNATVQREVPQVLTWFAARPHAFMKFVVRQPDDLEEVDSLVATYSFARERVLLMPEGRTPEILKSRSQWLAELARARGYRFTPRLHVLLWGDERGR